MKVGSELSNIETQINGVPQGAVISPTLFNIMINEIGKLEEKLKNNKIGLFADDVCIYQRTEKAYSTRSTTHFIEKTKEATETVIEKLEEKGFKTNIAKTQWIIFNKQKTESMKLNGKKSHVTK